MHIAFIFTNINNQLEKCGSNNAVKKLYSPLDLIEGEIKRLLLEITFIRYLQKGTQSVAYALHRSKRDTKNAPFNFKKAKGAISSIPQAT